MDKQTHIINQAKRLPITTRRAVVLAIKESIEQDEKKIDPDFRLAELIGIGEIVFDTTYEERRKAEKSVLIRNCIAKVMRMEGYTFSEIGKAMKRHTSSIMTMEDRADEMDAGFFGTAIRDKYYQFMKKAL